MVRLLKVLIVEDESLDLSLLLKIIEWEKLGLTICGVARDGLEAEQMMDKYQPDIVITDIVMPYKNGTELAIYIRKHYSNVRIIFISGHQDFDYALSGIEAEIDCYLLKPIDSVKLTNTLIKISGDIIAERRRIFEKEN